MEAKQQHSPNPPSSSSSLLRDISNFKTPKQPSQNPNLHSPHLQFFTASKQTPRSSSILRRHRPSLASSSARSKVSRRLKEFELEQCKSARKAQIDKEKSLKSLAKSLTVWLNFLLQNPVSCGCDLSKMTGQCGFEESDVKLVSGNGKRESSRGGGVGVDTPWRCPKRQRDSGWHGVVREESTVFSNSKLLALQSSLRDVCSFDDLKERMKVYLSLGSCKEVFNVMTQVTKNIDEGRLKMKPHCPIVTDVGLKEKASRILMCYNPIWLRIGLYIIFGGDSLLSDEDINSEKEIAFLKMVIEKQFFSHAGLARVYAYNKLVEGLYRPGYFEALGNVILKRFLLLVLVLDRAKSQSCLPIKYGIDGLDGGSPLLFTLQPNIKSSCQLIHDFLSSDVMHGEGNVLAHLVIVGYKVSYLQSPFNEYDFRVKELFEDLQDGVRLCRAIQLLQHDASILMKMLVPSDTRKKNVVNCGVALQHLKQAGVPLFDGDGSMIVAEDIVSGDKELTLSLLWNIFVHLQLPLLINKTLILEEISRIQGVNAEHLNNSTLLDMLLNWIQAICKSYDFKVDNFASLVDGKAMWCLLDYYFRKELNCSCSLKDIRETSGETSIMSVSDYTDAVHNFILSQKLTTLLGNFPEVLQVSDILEHNGPCNSQSVIILLVFLSFQLLVRKNTEQLNFHKLLGFTCQSPERRRLSMDQCFAHSEAILNQEDRHVYNTEGGMRNFKAIMAWWQDMAMRNKRFNLRPGTPPLQFLSTRRSSSTMQRENAAKIIQSCFRQSLARNNYLRIKNAVTFLQTVIRAWLAVKKKSAINKFCTSRVQEFSFEKQKQSDILGRYITYMVDRHNFVKLKRFVTIIEHATRAWISRRHHGGSILTQDMSTHDVVNAAIVVQKCIRGSTVRSIYFQRVSQLEKVSHACEETEVNDCQIKAASTIQLAWKKFLVHKSLCLQNLSATKIQTCYRGWLMRKSFVIQNLSATKIQSCYRGWLMRKRFIMIQKHIKAAFNIQHAWKKFLMNKALRLQNLSATKIQTCYRGWLMRKSFVIQNLSATKIQSCYRGWLMRKRFIMIQKHIKAAFNIQLAWKKFLMNKALRLQNLSATKIQTCYRGWLMRKSFVIQNLSATKIQSCYRGWLMRKRFIMIQKHIKAAFNIQFAWKKFLMNKALRLQNLSATKIQSCYRGWFRRKSFVLQKQAALKIQSIFQCLRCLRDFQQYKIATRSAIIIQSHTRGWIARRVAYRLNCLIVVIQSHCRGWLIRREIVVQKEAVIKIQSAFRCIQCQKLFDCYRHAATEIQRFVRGQIARRRVLDCFQNLELGMFLCSVLKLQRWWRVVLMHKSRSKSAIIIQSHIRGWIARQEATRVRHCIIVIQSYWKGYLARKASRGQLLDLRLRLHKSAANVDDSMRIINRLLVALSDLLSMKSVSGILHTCATLDMATKHSKKCCEKLVEAGAVDTLLKLIRSVSRSIPDQEVLKHALSTLRNLARYSHLTEVLIRSRGSVETILWELLRNKEEGYFIASELLRKICLNPKGVEAARNSPALLKRLHNLVEDLTRKTGNEKRNARGQLVREQLERRLREAVELLNLITNI